MRRPLLAFLAAGSVIAGTLALAPSASAVDTVDTSALRRAVTVNGVLGHERALQRIANDNGGTRSSGTPGFAASAAYVRGRLLAAGYRVSEQTFTFPFFRELAAPELAQVSPTPTTYTPATMTYSGSGTVTGRLVPTKDVKIPPSDTMSSTSGCEAADFVPASTTAPQVALVQRGTCTFEDKAANAQAAGYQAVAIFNEGQVGRQDLLFGTLGRPFTLPVVGLSFAQGKALYNAAKAGATTVRVSTSTEIRANAQTKNILAESPGGDPGNVVVIGAHLDSVPQGPGINDNGSGTSTILEIAEQASRLGINPRQKVRFAFWGAEEFGLLGSQHYVDSLSDTEVASIGANLNFDMLGSPNFARLVYDGAGLPAGPGRAGSVAIQRIFTRYFTSKDLASEPTALDGRSDYEPFSAVGIPVGGLFSGAEGVKTAEQVTRYGGTAGVAFDSCYHQACDTINNLSNQALSEMGDAAAHTALTLALTSTSLPSARPAPAARTSAGQAERRGSLWVR